MQYDNDQRLWLTPKTITMFRWSPSIMSFCWPLPGENTTPSSTRADLVNHPGGSAHIHFFQARTDPSDRTWLDSMKLLKPEPVACGITP